MTTKAHKLLTGTDLHEPKGVAAAPAGQVYVSDGAGSGVWATINTSIQFSTGDLKPTWKTTPDATWVMADDGTIGDASSGASNRANSDCQALFLLVWNNFSNTLAPVLPSRGGSAAADWAAHSKITLPKMLGRALGVAGAGSGLTARTIGSTTGAETVSLTQGNLPSGVTLPGTFTGSGPVFARQPNTWSVTTTGGTTIVLDLLQNTGGGGTSSTSVTVTGTTSTSLGGSGTAVTIMQPTTFVNIMVKL